MDNFTRNYSIVLGIIVVLLLGMWIKSIWQPRVWELNDLLASDTELANYPYQFRLRSLQNGMAILSTPRSFELPAIQFLPIIHPELANLAQDDPRMIEAQQELINHQKRAQVLMLGQEDIKKVDWELDVRWLADHGIQLPTR
ncbi:hypothetical protein [Thiospirillum jenense]|uniref:Glutamate-ammonia-ligase adenylyltransferase n=1 Tax=Thiospirillum jenense TaxID=1653858 RepID=A0A839HE87_9GAMM|nr:hypothetical protein [Thiospirillum jenense]MBB1126430.1 hypothetical protein [Thiospirillum jenense]